MRRFPRIFFVRDDGPDELLEKNLSHHTYVKQLLALAFIFHGGSFH